MSRDNVDTAFTSRLNKTLQTKNKTVSTNEFNLLHYVTSLYGNTLSAKGINLLDPIYTNMFYYNKMRSRPLTDTPYVTRTYAFFTRPELNFSFENINSVPFLKWLYDKPIGKMVMSMLTDPEYFINAPSFVNSNLKYAQDIKELMRKLNDSELKKYGDELADKMDTSTGNQILSVDENSEDDTEALARLQSLNLESLNDDAAIDKLINNNNLEKIQEYYKRYNDSVDSIYARMNEKASEAEKSLTEPGDIIVQAKNIMKRTHNDRYDNFNFTSPFIPLLMNTCTTLTGAKDLNLQIYEYEEDEFQTKQNVATGMDDIYAPGQINASFKDISYGPVSLLFMLWIFYIHYVSRGYITTTKDHISERILDYTCSIYVFVIGADGRTIERFGKYTGCYPTSFPLAQQLEHNDEVNQAMLQDVQITFQYNSYEPMNPEIFTDFNFISETEWLYKLKNWKDMYHRDQTLMESGFIDYLNGKYDNMSEIEKQSLHSAGRSELIWEMVSNPGMSGKVPRALINGTPVGGSNDLSRSDLMSDFWGGYPTIVNGKELIWVMPSWDDQSVTRDRGYNDKIEIL